MKTIKILLIAVLFIGAYSASAQSTSFFHDGTNLYYTGSGNVGIGTSTPAYILDVRKNTTEPKLSITNSGGAGGAAFRMYDQASNSDWRFKCAGTGTFKIRDNVSAKDVLTFEKNSDANSIYVKVGGLVGIGTATPTTALTVNGTVSSTGAKIDGKIFCREVEVTIAAFPDYVFGEDYHLAPLSEVEKFIKENKHLPGIPAAKEVIDNGLSLGEMNVKMMEKIEELTLYIISLQKEVDELKNKTK